LEGDSKIKIFGPFQLLYKMNKAYLLTGGNLGDRQGYLGEAAKLLHGQFGEISRRSSFYETSAWGKTDQPAFLNQALELQTDLNARQLIRKILKTEKSIGRVRKEKYGPRIIDIDILLFNEDIYDLPFLKVPHPELQNRRFALMPLEEIAGTIVHPVLHKTISQLLIECPDPLEVKKYS
jgi:2-amino-4-hydroxy-6-hydroxymethyldihydropteridine diphosphokinase